MKKYSNALNWRVSGQNVTVMEIPVSHTNQYAVESTRQAESREGTVPYLSELFRRPYGVNSKKMEIGLKSMNIYAVDIFFDKFNLTSTSPLVLHLEANESSFR
jgi:hypothetical protein